MTTQDQVGELGRDKLAPGHDLVEPPCGERPFRRRDGDRPVVDATAAWLQRAVAVRLGEGHVLNSGAPADVEQYLWTTTAFRAEVGLGGVAAAHDWAVAERLAAVVEMAHMMCPRPSTDLEASQAVAMLMEEGTSVSQRLECLRALGLGTATLHRVLVAAGPADAIDRFDGALLKHTERWRFDGSRVTTLLCLRLEDLAQLDVPRGLRVGCSNVHLITDAATARKQARATIRLTQPSMRDRGPYRPGEGVLLTYDSIGGYDIFAETLTAEHFARLDDLAPLDALIEVGGPAIRETLDTVVATSSLREAARMMEVHHNTVAHRVSVAERMLGFDVRSPYGRCRLFMALTMRRIRETLPLE